MANSKNKIKDKIKRVNAAWFVLLGLSCLALILYLILSDLNIAVLNPSGQIANQQFNLLIMLVLIMLIIAIPSLFLIYHFAWKYREENTKIVHSHSRKQGKLVVVGMWVIPTVFMMLIVSVMVPVTQKLAPAKQIESANETLTIQVVAMRWKWLFIYPEQNIASVNFVQLPVDRPVKFVLTADEAPMSSFWIPQLGGQLYAMTGHTNPLNLIAEDTGDYKGVNAEINGKGFTGMNFTARVGSEQDFESWVKDVQYTENTLDNDKYDDLLMPSEDNEVELYSSSTIDLYDKVLVKYNGPSDSHSHTNTEEGAH